jgi:hypothetical protein
MPHLLALLLTLLPAAHAKKPVDPCADSKATTDAFSGEQHIEYRALMWTLETSATASVWQLKVGTSGAVDVMLKAGWAVDLKLEDGTQFQLKTTVDTPPKMNASQYGITTQWMTRLPLTADIVRKLATVPIVAMRFDTGQGPQTWEGNDTFRKNISEAFGCAVTKIPAS